MNAPIFSFGVIVRGDTLPNNFIPKILWTKYCVKDDLEIMACRRIAM